MKEDIKLQQNKEEPKFCLSFLPSFGHDALNVKVMRLKIIQVPCLSQTIFSVVCF